MPEVTIEYCVPCGHLERATDVQQSLLEQFGQQLDAVRLETGDGGVFEVRVDGERVWDKTQPGDDSPAEAAPGAVRDRLEN
jgi:selenoprotein W-related protein